MVQAGLPADAPAGLAAGLSARDARVTTLWREGRRAYLTAESAGEPLFARYSTDPLDRSALAHEASVRGIVGRAGPLRTPPVLDEGPGWLIELRVGAGPVSGADCVDQVVAAARELQRHDLPALERGAARTSAVRTALRRTRLGLSRLPVRDVARARSILAASPLPLVTSHGDFHVGNVLVSDGKAWVVDWELSGRRPLGHDLMQLWATLPDARDRDRLWEGALALVGTEHEHALARLRYALVVRTIANMLAAPERFDRDSEGANRLLALLPALRSAAAAS